MFTAVFLNSRSTYRGWAIFRHDRNFVSDFRRKHRWRHVILQFGVRNFPIAA